jgi:hypothetical protein
MSAEPRGCLSLLFGQRRGAPTIASAPPPSTPTVERRTAPTTFPYKLRPSFLSNAERTFYLALQSATATRYVVFAKVRLIDLCADLSRGTDQAAFNRVIGKHIDFVLCDPVTFRFLAAIELDDSTHRRGDRVKRDAFVDEVFTVIGLPLLRFQVQLSYDQGEIKRRLESLNPYPSDAAKNVE